MADHWYDQMHRGVRTQRSDDSRDEGDPKTLAEATTGLGSTAVMLDDLAAQQAAILHRLDSQMARLDQEQQAREVLSTRIGRLAAAVEDLRTAPLTDPSTAQMVRDGVADEIRPLLLAIVELLELGVGQKTAVSSGSSRPDDLTLMQGIELPKILTRPLEDLLAPRPQAEQPAATARRSDNKQPSQGGLFARRRVADSPPADNEPASRRKNISPWTPVKS